MRFTKLFALAAMAFGLLAPAAAQDYDSEYKPTPYMFIGLQGGMQTTFTDYNPLKIATPTASVSFGAFFTPAVGVRIHVNGMWNKSGIKPDFTYTYKYVTTDLDLMLNLCAIFGQKEWMPVNLYLIGGLGLNYAWDNDDLLQSNYIVPYAWKDHNYSHNLRVGAMFDYNFSRHWSANLEVSMNSLSDRYNSKVSKTDEWQMTAQVGLAYKFGYKKRPIIAPVVVAPVEEFVDNKGAETVAAAPEKIQRDVFFSIGKASVDESYDGVLREVAEWMKSHPSARAYITGHADAGTGNPEINARLAAERAKEVASYIIAAGVEASRVTAEGKGDTVMPYGDNEKSRVAIVLAEE